MTNAVKREGSETLPPSDLSPKKRRMSAPNTSNPGRVDDVRIRSVNALLPPICLLEELPLEPHHADTVANCREALEKVFDGQVL